MWASAYRVQVRSLIVRSMWTVKCSPACGGTYDELAVAFQALVDDYVSTKYPRKEVAGIET